MGNQQLRTHVSCIPRCRNYASTIRSKSAGSYVQTIENPPIGHPLINFNPVCRLSIKQASPANQELYIIVSLVSIPVQKMMLSRLIPVALLLVSFNTNLADDADDTCNKSLDAVADTILASLSFIIQDNKVSTISNSHGTEH